MRLREKIMLDRFAFLSSGRVNRKSRMKVPSLAVVVNRGNDQADGYAPALYGKKWPVRRMNCNESDQANPAKRGVWGIEAVWSSKLLEINMFLCIFELNSRGGKEKSRPRLQNSYSHGKN
jgi:hypothetical protein